VVAEGLGLGNGPTGFSSLVAATGHVGLIRDATAHIVENPFWPELLRDQQVGITLVLRCG
jgi:hypothetical protein